MLHEAHSLIAELEATRSGWGGGQLTTRPGQDVAGQKEVVGHPEAGSFYSAIKPVLV